MWKITLVLIIYLLLSCFTVWGGDPEDSFGSIADYLDGIYGIDDNAGLTAFPILNIPLGGRSEGMASAFAAVCDDVSFIEFNPAGSSMLEKSELAFFHNNWISDVKIEGAAYAVRFGDLGLAAAAKWLYTPFTEYNYYGERVSNGYYSEGVAILNASYKFLSSYSFSGISIGINLKGAFRVMPDYSNKEDDTVIGGSGMEQSAVMGMADIGVLTRFNLFKFYASRENNMSAALVARNLGPPVLDEPLPVVFNVALSYKPIRPLLFSFDFFLPLNLMEPEYSEAVYFAFGLSANVTGFLSMRGGVMLKAGSSRFTIGSALNLNKIALDVNYTLDLLTQLQPMNRVSLAVRFDLGDDGRRLRTSAVETLYLKGIDAYSQGNFNEAKYYWEEALRLDPKFVPAIQSLDMLYSREQLEQRIDGLQKLD